MQRPYQQPDRHHQREPVPDSWLAQREHPQLALIIHELAHAYADTPGGHGPAWGEACAQVGGKIAAAP